jgi:hypothetical protein
MGRTIATATLALLLGTAAYAQSVHLKPPNQDPTFSDGGLTLNVTGNLAGLGNGDVLIFLSATAIPTATCTNPSGGTQPPGHNPAPVTVTGTQVIPDEQVDNGNVTFSVTTTAPTSPIPGAPDCPNRRWSEIITDVAFDDPVIVRVEQGGTTVLRLSCTFTSPTTNGTVPDANVSCTPTS